MPGRSPSRALPRLLLPACIVAAGLLSITIALSYVMPIGGVVSRTGVIADRSLLSVVHCTHELAWDDPNPPGRRSGTAAWKVGGAPPVAWIALGPTGRPELQLFPVRRSASVAAATTTGSGVINPIINLDGWNIPLLPPLAILLITAIALWYFGPRRRAAWECVKCGYDLRGTTLKCPECGTPAACAARL